MVYRLTLTMLAAVTEDGQFSDSGAFAAAMDNSDAVIVAEGDWSAPQWQDVARHLALLVAGGMAARMGPDEATAGRQQTVTALGAAGVGEHFVDKITVHQSCQHTQADPVGQPVRPTAFTT